MLVPSSMVAGRSVFVAYRKARHAERRRFLLHAAAVGDRQPGFAHETERSQIAERRRGENMLWLDECFKSCRRNSSLCAGMQGKDEAEAFGDIAPALRAAPSAFPGHRHWMAGAASRNRSHALRQQ